MFEVWGLILHLLSLVLRASLNSAPDSIHKRPRISKILLEKGLEINPRQGSYTLNSSLVLMSSEANPTTKEQSCKLGMVGPSRAGGVEMVFTRIGSTPCVTSHSRGPGNELWEGAFEEPGPACWRAPVLVLVPGPGPVPGGTNPCVTLWL